MKNIKFLAAFLVPVLMLGGCSSSSGKAVSLTGSRIVEYEDASFKFNDEAQITWSSNAVQVRPVSGKSYPVLTICQDDLNGTWSLFDFNKNSDTADYIDLWLSDQLEDSYKLINCSASQVMVDDDVCWEIEYAWKKDSLFSFGGYHGTLLLVPTDERVYMLDFQKSASDDNDYGLDVLKTQIEPEKIRYAELSSDLKDIQDQFDDLEQPKYPLEEEQEQYEELCTSFAKYMKDRDMTQAKTCLASIEELVLVSQKRIDALKESVKDLKVHEYADDDQEEKALDLMDKIDSYIEKEEYEKAQSSLSQFNSLNKTIEEAFDTDYQDAMASVMKITLSPYADEEQAEEFETIKEEAIEKMKKTKDGIKKLQEAAKKLEQINTEAVERHVEEEAEKILEEEQITILESDEKSSSSSRH